MTKRTTLHTFAERMREARGDRNYSQTDLQNVCGFAHGTINHYEACRRAPSLENIRKISTALGVSIDWLFGVDECSP